MTKRSKITYLTLGLGIGIIIASTFYSFYPQIEQESLSDDIIIERAKELGMVSLKESINVDSLEKKEIEEKRTEEIVATEESLEESVEAAEIIEEIEIIVESGSSLTSVATKLHNANLIDDKDEFILFVKEKKLDKRIITGKYKIINNSSHDEIIEILTRRPK